MKRITLLTTVVALGVTPLNVSAGIFKVEVPPEVTPEEVLSPTPELKAQLEQLLREKITRHPAFVFESAVAFTKGGEIIYRTPEAPKTSNWADNRITFEPAGLFLEIPGSWEAAEWHLHEVGQPEYNGVYDLAQDIFGYPFYPGNLTVYVEWDPTLPEEVPSYYHITNQTVYLRNC